MAGKKGGKSVSGKGSKRPSLKQPAQKAPRQVQQPALRSQSVGSRSSRAPSFMPANPCAECLARINHDGRASTGKAYRIKRIISHYNNFKGDPLNQRTFRYKVKLKGKCHTDGCDEWLKPSSLNCDSKIRRYWQRVKEYGKKVKWGGQRIMDDYLARELGTDDEETSEDEDDTGCEGTTGEETDDDDNDDNGPAAGAAAANNRVPLAI